MAINITPGVGPQNSDIASAVATSAAVSSQITANVPSASSIATAVAAPSAATIASAVAAPSAATIAAAVAAPSAATIATSVAAAVPTISAINTSVQTYASSKPTWTYLTQAAWNIAGTTFSSLSGYKMYKVLLFNCYNTSSANQIILRLNGDTSANYIWSYVYNAANALNFNYGYGATGASVSYTTNATPANINQYSEIVINDANTANNFKTGDFWSLGPNGFNAPSINGKLAWNSTASVTSITVLQNPANGLSSGGTVYLYGAN